MKKKDMNIKFYAIIAIFVAMVGLIIFGVIYAIGHRNESDVYKVDTGNFRFTLDEDQLDGIKQPEVNVDVIYYTLPTTKSTLEYINVDTLKKLFQNEKKSIVVLSDEGCSNCAEYLPKLENSLNNMGYSAYVIDKSKLNSNELKELSNYIDYEGTPTTYIISNSKVHHVLTGNVDEDVAVAFIDYFYTRNN